MDASGSVARSGSHVLGWIGWILAAVAAYVAWGIAGFALLIAGTSFLGVYGPEEAPLWLAYSMFVVEIFVWPLILMLATRNISRLNRALFWIVGATAVLPLLNAALVATWSRPDWALSGPVALGRHLASGGMHAGGLALLQAALTGLVLVVAGWSNKRFQRTADMLGNEGGAAVRR